MRSPIRSLLLASLLLPVFAGAAEPAPLPPPLAHRSSIAAVLAHRGALQLTPDQVKVLEHADSVLARDQEAARAAASQTEENPSGDAAARPPSGQAAPPGGKGGMSGAKVRPPSGRRTGPDPAEVLEQQLDVLDAEALLKVAESLPEAQREKALEVASRYREQLYEQRQRERSR